MTRPDARRGHRSGPPNRAEGLNRHDETHARDPRPPCRARRRAPAAVDPAVVAVSPTPIVRRRLAGPVARGARRRGRVRHPRRGDPAAVRPAVRLEGPAHPGPPRAGRAGTPPPGTRRPPARSASASPPPARARPTWSPRSPTRTWTRCRSSRSPVRWPRPAIGTDAFQEADIQGITLPITKHNFLVQTPEEIPQILAEAFHLASTGRPGPVLVDIPKDVLQAQTMFSWPPHAGPARLPADPAPARQADPRGGPADRGARSARCSTSAAACSRPAPPTGCASWPS